MQYVCVCVCVCVCVHEFLCVCTLVDERVLGQQDMGCRFALMIEESDLGMGVSLVVTAA